MLSALILVYSIVVVVVRPYGNNIHNVHIILIQASEVFIAIGLTIKQYFLETHQVIEPKNELIWAWIVIGLLMIIDLMAIVRIYMVIQLKKEKVD